MCSYELYFTSKLASRYTSAGPKDKVCKEARVM